MEADPENAEDGNNYSLGGCPVKKSLLVKITLISVCALFLMAESVLALKMRVADITDPSTPEVFTYTDDVPGEDDISSVEGYLSTDTVFSTGTMITSNTAITKPSIGNEFYPEMQDAIQDLSKRLYQIATKTAI